MKVLILGATGGTGQQLVKHALDKGLDVNVLVRSPDNLKITESGEAKLRVIKGSALDAEALADAMTGCKAVVSTIGGKAGIFTPCDVYSKTGDVIVKVMKDLNISRFVACTSWGTKDDPGLPFVLRWVFKTTILRNGINDMSIFEDNLVAEAGPEINWTVVRPPRLTDGPPTGDAPFAQEGQFVPGGNNIICRADLASFMLDCLTTDQWDGKMVAVAGRPDKT